MLEKSAALCNIPPRQGEKGADYLMRTRELWQQKTGEDPVGEDTVGKLFRGAVENSLPKSVQDRLRTTIGLNAMGYKYWEEHIRVYLDNEIERQAKEDKELRGIQAQLAKAQLKKMRDEG